MISMMVFKQCFSMALHCYISHFGFLEFPLQVSFGVLYQDFFFFLNAIVAFCPAFPTDSQRKSPILLRG